jgi:formylmethanofuran dehydrogenase subunit B
MTEPRLVERVTCLGCGCACDDVGVQLQGGRIVGITPDCPVGRRWFGDGTVSDKVLVEGRSAALDDALAAAAEMLTRAVGRALVYLGPDLSTQAQRGSVALADLIGATVDSATSEVAAAGLLAAQRRGRAAATLGEIRNRADVLLFWAVNPEKGYPRYLSRYALDPVGTHVPRGRSGRTVISVSVGSDRGPAGANRELALEPDDETAALSILRAAVLQRPIPDLPPRLKPLPTVAEALLGARYAVLVHEAEPGTGRPAAHRAEGLLALTEALNGPTRAALSSLRKGGNRSGAESVLTWQTGFPMAVDFSPGYPRYDPGRRGLGLLASGGLAAALVVGSASDLPAEAVDAMSRVPTVAIGPRSSVSCPGAHVIIDTGVAGIHEGGTAYRMDEVPLPLSPPLPGPRSAQQTLRSLLGQVRARLSRSLG